MRSVVGVMARAPSAGGKSRLIRDLAGHDGVALRRALIQDTLASVARVDGDKAVLYTPDDGETEVREITPFPAICLPQRGATLGDRMKNGIHDLMALGFRAVVLVGADLPTLPPAYVADALRRLSEQPRGIVLGPSEDGGYYLIGMTEMHGELFQGISWGSREVLSRTIEAAAAIGTPVDLFPAWHDIDVPSDLRRLLGNAGAPLEPASHTRAWLDAAAPDFRAVIESEPL
jgi:rSAM/selenodomain-associated transferase 1